MHLLKLIRLRWRTRSLVLFTIFLLAIVCSFPIVNANANANARAKPYDSVEYGSEADVSETLGQSDDIYDPSLLQEEVEHIERHAQQNQYDSDAEEEQFLSATKMPPAPFKTRKMPNNYIENTHIANEHENITEEEDVPRRKTSSEEYYDDQNIKESLKNVRKRPDLTTIPPEYVNHAKFERKLQHNDANASSDYTEETVELTDNDNDKLDERINKNSHPEFARRKKTFVEQQRSMKNYSNQRSDIVDDETDSQHRLERKHKQLLPKRQHSRNFNVVAAKTHHDNDSDHYDEYFEEDESEAPIQRYNIPKLRRTTLSPSSENVNFQHQPVLGSDFVIPTVPTWVEQIDIENKTAIPATETPSSLSSSSTASSIPHVSTNSTTPIPMILYDTTLPTPLALGPFISTLTAATTGLPSVISATPDTLVPVTTTTTTTTTTTSTTTLRPGGKQGKQINISRRKLQPHEKLRNYIEDAYIRMPLAVIVDPSNESLEKTKALWRDALRTNFNIKIILVSLNASGIPAAYNFNNTRQFLAGLNSIKEHDGGNAFIGIVHASELVPYDSAVFISTATLPPHTELVQDAAITLLKKRIRLYLLWFGERSLSENETQEAVGGILGEVAIRSGGDILHIVGSENSQELEGGNTLVLVANAFRGAQEIEIPVDTTLSSLHVKIDAPTRTATLETPNGDINLKKLIKLRSHMFMMNFEDRRLDAYVPLTKLRKSSIFTLKINPKSLEDEYDVFVRADRKADHFLEDIIKRFDAYFMDGISYNPLRFRENRLQSIRNALKAVIPTHENIKFPDKSELDDTDDNIIDANSTGESKKEPKTEVETFSETEIHRDANDAEKANTTAEIIANTLRALGSQQQLTRSPLQMSVTKIEMSAKSQVLVAPGTTSQLFFEITNTRTEAVFHNIQVVDERRYLLRLVPQSIFLRPGETVTVSVTVVIPQGTPQGTIDRITFTCHGSGTASLSLNLKVSTNFDAQDTLPPTITWSFGSRCDYIAADSPNCAERFWTLDITAQDWETGILRLQSTPTNRLYYRNSYTVGSTEPLKATYVATCCEPKVSLLAYDIAGNQKSSNIDVRDIVLTDASIAAIVLGALLLLLLIVLLIWGIIYCCRRRKVILDLPTYRSHSTRSME